jgi:hypothetical protein
MYTHYIQHVKNIVNLNNLTTFKSNAAYREILEHCSQAFGNQYYDILRNEFGMTNDVILNFCQKNDAIGNPVKCTIGELSVPVSPASVLYMQHAALTLNHIQELGLSRVNIVEVGCGYGGYLLALDYLSAMYDIHIESYTCIDLDVVCKLQMQYLSNFEVSFPVHFQDASEYGKSVKADNLFFVSIYCFSEIDRIHQQGYLTHLIPKASHGLMIWNMKPFFDIGKEIVYKGDERPYTGPGNLLVLF